MEKKQKLLDFVVEKIIDCNYYDSEDDWKRQDIGENILDELEINSSLTLSEAEYAKISRFITDMLVEDYSEDIKDRVLERLRCDRDEAYAQYVTLERITGRMR